MPSWPLTVALIAAVAIVFSGCQSGQLRAQQQELEYQTQIGHVNELFSHGAGSPQRSKALLQRAIGEYRTIRPPARLRKLNERLIAALRGELRSFQDAAAAERDPVRIRRAEALNTRSRAAVSRLLGQIAAVVGACRKSAAQC